MANENVTAIRDLRPFTIILRDEIGEQQHRLWQLRNLIEAIQGATREGNDINDLDAALGGLIEMADQIHEALDPEEVWKRAEQTARKVMQHRPPEPAPGDDQP